MSEYDARVAVIAERTLVAMHAFWSAMLHEGWFEDVGDPHNCRYQHWQSAGS